MQEGNQLLISFENFSKRFAQLLDHQTIFRSHLGVKTLKVPIINVTNHLKRVNQKFIMWKESRGTWDSSIQALETRNNANTRFLAKKGIPGYGLVDRALAAAAETIPESFRMDVDYPNLGFLSWSPLKKPTYKILDQQKIADIHRKNTTQRIKKLALWFGASLVGVTLLNRKWVYSHWYDGRSSPPRNPRIVFSDESGFNQYSEPVQLKDGTQVIPKDMKYVIMLAFEMQYQAMYTAPSAIAQAGTYMYGYRKVVQTVATLAEFIRGIGYHAIPSIGDTCLKVPMAIEAGLGEDGRHGLLITPEYGPRVRLGAVITDLPLISDHPVTFGIHEFCNTCQKCAQMCPGNAIPSGSRGYGFRKNNVDAPTISESIGAFKWIKNSERCKNYWAQIGTNCGICIRVCPWNKPTGWLYTLAKGLAIRGSIPIKRMLIKMDDIFNYGNQMNPDNWWDQLKVE
jgi:reductive dehalogenase